MTITIPAWILWTAGIAGGLIAFAMLVFYAYVGWQLSKMFWRK